MENGDIKKEKFWAGGILYNSKTKEVLLQKRDAIAPVNPDMWGFSEERVRKVRRQKSVL